MNHRQLQINELTLILNEHFQWNKVKMACFAGMLTAIMIFTPSEHFAIKVFTLNFPIFNHNIEDEERTF
jgi:hypothetical protein